MTTFWFVVSLDVLSMPRVVVLTIRSSTLLRFRARMMYDRRRDHPFINTTLQSTSPSPYPIPILISLSPSPYPHPQPQLNPTQHIPITIPHPLLHTHTHTHIHTPYPYPYPYPPPSPSLCVRTQVTGEPLMQRKDDNPTTLKTRLSAYHDATSPVIDYYRRRGLVNTIAASKPREDVTKDILSGLEK